jgi:hypothetical protein
LRLKQIGGINFSMQGPTKERWQELCERAAIEQDSDKLPELVKEIDRLLAEKQDRLSNKKRHPGE